MKKRERFIGSIIVLLVLAGVVVGIISWLF